MTEQPTLTRMTAQAFAQLPETSQRMELIDGELIVSPSPIDRHQEIVVQLVLLLGALEVTGRIGVAPLDVYLDAHNVVQPDVFWLPPNTTCARIDGYYHGAPEWVAEVTSPSTAKLDRYRKFQLYQQAGVLEYWMVDPANAVVEVYQREGERLERMGACTVEDSFASPVLGITVAVRRFL